MRIWVTRAAPEAARTADRLLALGHQPILAPVLQAHGLPGEIDLDGVGALAFTSLNAVRSFVEKSRDRGLPVFAVGDATARAARDAGFASVVSAQGDVAALAGLIAAHAGRLAGIILHPAALEPAGDLVGDLARAGLQARILPVYETRPLPVSPEIILRLSADPIGLDGVLIHSPRGAGVVAEALAGQAGAARLQAFCISAAAGQPLEGLALKRIVIAAEPTEAALLAALAA